jgi:hypothetical protein
MSYVSELDDCKDFGDIFKLVKRAVEQFLGERRSGLMLYLANLPLNVGAFHGVGTNAIVMNRVLLEIVTQSAKSRRELNSFIFSILLHEYLHSLGHVDEREVRELAYEVAKRSFGENHPAAEMAVNDPTAFLTRIPKLSRKDFGESLEVVKDFDRSSRAYIA